MKKPEVSVITCVYNGEKYLKEAIDSILSQTYTDFELIIVDDCSSDNSRKMLEDYAKADPRIKLIFNKENIGTYASANEALKQAKGKYIARLDADDIAWRNRLAVQYKYMEENPNTDLVGSWVILIDENSNIVAEKKTPFRDYEVQASIFIHNQIVHSSAFFRKTSAEEVGYYSTKNKKAQDYDLYLKILANGGRVENIPQYLVLYRTHPTNMTSTQFDSQEEIGKQLIIKFSKEIINLETDIEAVTAVRRAYYGHLDGFGRSMKLKVVRYARNYTKAINATYPEWQDLNLHARVIAASLVEGVVFNRFLRFIFKLYIRL